MNGAFLNADFTDFTAYIDASEGVSGGGDEFAAQALAVWRF